ncbi:uncharacterized protein [Anabrus simplex]|uniref:uncharacterized protein n=1 Tax=Anabrus simplex TaxID=316456 RepID=UPI0035A35CA2
MGFLKCTLLLLTAIAAGVAEPQRPGNNQYLPPDPNKGYDYNPPSVPFPPPNTPPQRPPVRPPPQTPVRPPPQTPVRPPPQTPVRPPPQTPVRPPPQTPVRPPPQTPGLRPPPPTYGQPPAPGPGEPGHVHIPGMPYDFNYAVKDATYGTDYSHNAASDGDVVKGEWRVQLPDGRLQIVRYTADWATGFHADVSYEGEARYPPAAPQGGYGPPRNNNLGSGGGYSGPPPPAPGSNGGGVKRPNGGGGGY